ncbi:MAG: protein tyrosine kinase [Burkholderia sp.]|nr:protein tyrosine kinase [Burkholderia sp.]
MGIIEKAANRLGQTSARDMAPKPELPRKNPVELEPVPPIVQPAAPIPPGPASKKRVELNLARLQEQGMITPDGGRSAVAEEFRAIKRTLLDRIASEGAKSKRSNLIMVTSSLPSEGKTFSSINLAMSIAMEMDHTVLLVDADVARPSVLRTLGLKPESGLMDILLDRNVQVQDVLLKTNVNTLSILPAGPAHRHSTELLASQAMSRLLDEIASRYADRIVIFDSPPLLLTTEARALASQMGQIVMVVEAESTTQKALKNALRQIEACPNVNLVYNKSKAFPGGDNYGYYSYYK